MIYVTGDCHGNFARFEQKHFPEQANMTKDDTVIITGDCGGVWFGDSRDDETLDWLERLPFTLAFVCGNHENYDALARYPVAEWRGGKVHCVRPHVLHLMRGEPVWCKELECYGIVKMEKVGSWANELFLVGTWHNGDAAVNFEYDIKSRGLTLYRHKPEEGTV